MTHRALHPALRGDREIARLRRNALSVFRRGREVLVADIPHHGIDVVDVMTGIVVAGLAREVRTMGGGVAGYQLRIRGLEELVTLLDESAWDIISWWNR